MEESKINVPKVLIQNTYRSFMRALKRGHIAPNGFIAPKRPFNNRKNTCTRGKDSREMNTYKKYVYECFKQRLNRE